MHLYHEECNLPLFLDFGGRRKMKCARSIVLLGRVELDDVYLEVRGELVVRHGPAITTPGARAYAHGTKETPLLKRTNRGVRQVRPAAPLRHPRFSLYRLADATCHWKHRYSTSSRHLRTLPIVFSAF